jgi:NAD(P)-dependent dehydrogenase (short-subunit alcohol dehydrogenase family)
MTSHLPTAFDALLDKTVVLSYTRIGYGLRRRIWDAADLDVDMSGKRCLVTGANSGLGLAAAKQLARLGASVTMVARNPDRGQAAQAEVIAQTGNRNVDLEIVDVSSLAAVRTFAARFVEATDRLDVLINNAGVLLPQRRLSVDGIELSFATNVVGPFLLTNLLLPLLERSRPARVIFVSSGGMYAQKLDVDDLQSEREPFNGTIAYARHKRAQVILTEMWAERLAGSGVTVNVMHPGWADTPGVQTSLPAFWKITRLFLRTPEQGADTVVWLAVAPHIASESGKFWFDRRERETHKLARTVSPIQDRQRLWDACVRLSELAGTEDDGGD